MAVGAAEGSAEELVQGRCPVDGGTFVCAGVRLSGETGARLYLTVAIVTDEVAERLRGAATLPLSSTAAHDQTQVYKG